VDFGTPRTGSMKPDNFRGIFREDLDARGVYSEAAGIARIVPLAVAVPVDEEDVSALVQWASREGHALIPRGSGSGMAGGAVGRGIVVDLSRLNKIGPVDVARKRIQVGAGALRDQIDASARAEGLRFPVDPSSGAFCTIGGMIATNAAGARSLRFGSTRLWVTALDCVFNDGERATVRRGEPPPGATAITRFLENTRASIAGDEGVQSIGNQQIRKNSSGYRIPEYVRSGELIDLLVGSEGTLALFTGAELALAPLPGATTSLLASFPSLDGAVRAAMGASEAGAVACELIDRTFLEVAALEGAPTGVELGTEAVLLVEVEGDDRRDAAATAKVIERAFLRAGATSVRLAIGEIDERALWELRHAASPILSRLDPALKSMQFIEDGAVPIARLGDYVQGVRDALSGRGIRGVIFGHAGDGHVHVNPLIDVTAANFRERIEELIDEITDLTVALGGTLSGEHGDGRLRTPLLSRTWRWPAAAMFLAVKRAFDPSGILNPGVKVPLPGQTVLEDIKYDPALRPLTQAARAALDIVERERAYATPRLDLLHRRVTPAGGMRPSGG
jgi:FAD/FMN-containing dehydrogenase